MHYRFIILLLFGGMTLSSVSCGVFQKSKNSKSAAAPKKKPDKDGVKPYSKVITKEAKTDEGLFTVHKIKNVGIGA